MTIVSISLTEEILKEIDNLQKSMGFSGRSDAIRAGIRSFVAENPIDFWRLSISLRISSVSEIETIGMTRLLLRNIKILTKCY